MKSKKPAQKKLSEEDSKKISREDYNRIPESEINPNGKEDFEKVLTKIFPPVEPKTKK